MANCTKCGAPMPDGAVFCPSCGQLAAAAKSAAKQHAPRRRWLIWVLVLLALCAVPGRLAGRTASRSRRQTVTVTAAAAPTAAPATAPAATPEPTDVPLASEAVRPQVKEFLDSYEEFMDEYAAFMTKYQTADSAEMVSMLGDYYSMLTRYAQFAEQAEALEKEDLSAAELAYYLEVTGRVNKKLLAVIG